MHTRLLSRSLVLLGLLVGCSLGTVQQADRHAYVTIHYEGTPADDEYILGIRVLIQSLKPLRHPFLILISDNVSQKSRDLFVREGATLIQVG